VERKCLDLRKKPGKMSPDKMEFVCFVMRNTEADLRSAGGIVKNKERFRSQMREKYSGPQFDDKDNNSFGWAFKFLFDLGITERSSTGPYKLRDIVGQ
jgi:hypothetical protein